MSGAGLWSESNHREGSGGLFMTKSPQNIVELGWCYQMLSLQYIDSMLSYAFLAHTDSREEAQSVKHIVSSEGHAASLSFVSGRAERVASRPPPSRLHVICFLILSHNVTTAKFPSNHCHDGCVHPQQRHSRHPSTVPTHPPPLPPPPLPPPSHIRPFLDLLQWPAPRSCVTPCAREPQAHASITQQRQCL